MPERVIVFIKISAGYLPASWGVIHFCGEVVDIDAETGGYNLQAAFSTGYVTGENAATFVIREG
jgi:predicted flavoprotein YhiN